ncbi:hypothetical protein M408DRAFT_139390 [Serendipita vermifera MAFF 305830]|uniref:Uncharacterized protein n=1 Tax=Serendipita vermifera MAFF 305830 TaxID=933852 RepID=A0A0C2WQR5_SERVB|nr:hypothetical protein M408DRAFT_168173 [Serendipita vermifera MAFF 305830]KIM28305.1 hypothetical protein M408DRAFT_139390 [Serendipita vermifera MAFF 305830]
MSSLFSKLSKSRHNKETGATPSHSPRVSSDSTSPSSSASVSNTNLGASAPKKGIRQSVRDRFSTSKHPPKVQQQQLSPPTTVPTNETVSQIESLPENTGQSLQDDSLQSKRLDIELAEDPHDQQKLKAIEYSIQAISLFEDLSKVLSLLMPDALGQALGKITEILTILKKMVENKQAWKELLISIDNKQKMFNEQLKGVKASDLPQNLVDAMRNYAQSLEGLAARVMKQAGVVQEDAPKGSPTIRIGAFANRFLNADSDSDDIIAYKAELNAIVGEFQVRMIKVLMAELTFYTRLPSRYIFPLWQLASIGRQLALIEKPTI